ncbi:TraR/DksA family transcriptional regulator [Geodermatophilus sp. SYSU D00703]
MTSLADPAATATDWASFRGLLESQRADCVRQRELALVESATSVPDPVAVNRAAGLARTIEEIDAALARIAAGTYGRCVHCGNAIPVERLEFRPFAAGCVSCQQSR